jgi:hypothetical protein
MAIITAVAVGAAVAGAVVASRASAAAGSRAKAAAAQSAGAERNAREVEVNARRRERLANDILEKGKADADVILAQALEIRANQRASQAASGVVVDSGSTRIVQEDTMRLAQADAIVTMQDAINRQTEVKSAGQFEDLASFSRERAALVQGQSAAAAARAQSTASIIGGVSSAVGAFA